MNEEAFVKRRQASWTRLGWLVDKASGSPSALSADELSELVREYRAASADLAHARTFGNHPPLIDSLNDLVGRAYGVIHRRGRRRFTEIFVAMLIRAAQTVRRRRVFIFASLILLLGSAFGAYFLGGQNPEFRDAVAGGRSNQLFKKWKEGEFDERTSETDASMTLFYMSNNPRVSIIAGAVGTASFGILSAQMMAHNGALIGVLASEMSSVGKLPFLLLSITPHGITEMSGAAIAAAAGLLLGWSLIDPGRRSRMASLKAAGPDAGVLLLIGVAQTFMAAPIEGFFSFNRNIPLALKGLVAVISLVAWLLFWNRFGRTEDEAAVAEALRG